MNNVKVKICHENNSTHVVVVVCQQVLRVREGLEEEAQVVDGEQMLPPRMGLWPGRQQPLVGPATGPEE